MLERGDIVFVRGRETFVDDAIRVGEMLLDKVPYADAYVHVAIFLGGNMVMEAQGGRKAGISFLGQYEGDYDIGHVLLTKEQREMVVEAAKKLYGRRYDWWLIFYIALEALGFHLSRFHERKKRICSTLVYDAYKAAGVVLCETSTPTPNELLQSHKVSLEKGSEF